MSCVPRCVPLSVAAEIADERNLLREKMEEARALARAWLWSEAVTEVGTFHQGEEGAVERFMDAMKQRYPWLAEER